MRIILGIVFSFYLLVGAFYCLYGESDIINPGLLESIYRVIWHSSRELLTLVLAYFMFLVTFDTKTKEICRWVGIYQLFHIGFNILSVFGLASSSDPLWSGISIMFIFVVLLILFSNE